MRFRDRLRWVWETWKHFVLRILSPYPRVKTRFLDCLEISWALLLNRRFDILTPYWDVCAELAWIELSRSLTEWGTSVEFDALVLIEGRYAIVRSSTL